MKKILLFILFLILFNDLRAQKISKAETIEYIIKKVKEVSIYEHSTVQINKDGYITFKYDSSFHLGYSGSFSINIADVNFESKISPSKTYLGLWIQCVSGYCILHKEYSSGIMIESKKYEGCYVFYADNPKEIERLVKAFKNLKTYYPIKKDKFD
jgi:hypothetical protein